MSRAASLTGEVVSPLAFLRGVRLIRFHLVRGPRRKIDSYGMHVSNCILVEVIGIDIAQIWLNLHNAPALPVSSAWLVCEILGVSRTSASSAFKVACSHLLLLVIHSFEVVLCLRVGEAEG